MLDDEGFAEIPTVLSAGQCAELAAELDGASGGRVGSRNLLDMPCCKELAVALKTHIDVAPLLPPVAVQCTLFDKSADKNWLVALHQDLSIPVLYRVSDPRCTGWSEKEGVTYVQPPVPVLESLVAVRVHLDDCGQESGPLRIIPRSHRYGRLTSDVAIALREQHGEVELIPPRGGAIAMRPLLLHSSSKALSKSRRRVLHFLYGPKELPFGLTWHCTV